MTHGTKTYTNSLAGFRKWCKNNPWNSMWEEKTERMKIGNVYCEFSVSEFKYSFYAFASLRVYDKEKANFELVMPEDLPTTIREEIRKTYKEYANKHDADFLEL